MTEMRTIQEQLRDGHVSSHRALRVWMVEIPATLREQAADRIDELEDVLRDATEAESLLKPEQRSPWFTKALTVLSALTPKVPT